MKSEQIINVKRVRYDEETKKIIIEINNIDKEINKQVSPKIIIQKELLDLKDLISLESN